MLPKNTPRTGCIFASTLPTPNLNPSNQLQAHRCNVTPPNVASPKNVAPKCGVTGKCGVTKQCVAKECGAKMWRHRKMWRHQTMWRQTMWRQNVASQENVASPNNVGAKQCSAKMWRHRKMRRHQTMWRQRRWRHMSSKCVFIMCLQPSGGKVRALLPTPCISNRNSYGMGGASSILEHGTELEIWRDILRLF